MGLFDFFKSTPSAPTHGMRYRSFGKTGIMVSEMGYGTVKLGRNTAVKYPSEYDLPTDEQVASLLNHLRSLGVNLLDTSPAYGKAEAMLGRNMGKRSDWVIASKAGEVFDGTESRYYFNTDFIKKSIERSLNKLQTDYLDIFMLHLNYIDEIPTLKDEKLWRMLDDLKSQGVIRATGASIYTVKGGKLALDRYDGAMVTYNPNHLGEEEVIRMAEKLNKGILIKKALGAGNLDEFGDNPLETCFKHVLKEKGVSSMLISSLTPANLTQDAEIIKNLSF